MKLWWGKVINKIGKWFNDFFAWLGIVKKRAEPNVTEIEEKK